MGFKKMSFKGKPVFVEVDDADNILESGGRAVMKYRLEDDRTYSPAIANLSASSSNDKGGGGDLFSEPASGTNTKNKPPKTSILRSRASTNSPKIVSRAMPSNAVVAYTDGGCIGNPGPAGLGYVIRYPGDIVEQKGEPMGQGTNNIAELTAIYRVLQVVSNPNVPLRIHTDSAYAIGVLTMGWKAKANQQLIAQIKRALSTFSDVQLIKVKGHAGNPDNELVDTLANSAARTQKVQE